MIRAELQKDNLWVECRRDWSEWKLEAERTVKKKKKKKKKKTGAIIQRKSNHLKVRPN